MPRAFSEIAYTASVRAAQERYGSRQANAGFDSDPLRRDTLGDRELEFIPRQDSFFMASVGETGWPYVQHRGGPKGLLKILDARTLGFADFSGNRQYISVGNLSHDDRVVLLLIDHARRQRLKVWGRARIVHEDEAPELIARLEVPSYRARIERAYLIRVEALDFNCPQHITPRYTEEEIAELVTPVRQPLAAHQEPAEVLGLGSLELVVSGIRQLTPRVRAYELRRADGGALPVAPAGSHLTLPVPLDNGRVKACAYSLTTDPGRSGRYEIAVLREGSGSAALHRHYALGLRLRCEPPRNAFPLHADARPAVLIAGGIGITPLKAMAETLLAEGRVFELHYAARGPGEAAYRDELVAALGTRLHCYDSTSRRLALERVFDQAPAEALFYVCGPTRLIDAVLATAAARGLPPERVRYERFGTSAASGDNRPVEVVLKWAAKTLQVPAERSILDALLAAGVDIPHACRAGTCGSCAVKVIDGEPEHRDQVLSAEERERAGLLCVCVSRARGERLVLDL